MPLVKWPGGKRFLSAALVDRLAAIRFRFYHEPFAGGAALFFALSPTRAFVSDTNAELINLYQVTRDKADQLILTLSSRRFRNSEDSYYKIRQWDPTSNVDRAARFYFLMRLSFNGIYRENLSGQFNVPYGHKIHLTIYDENAIRRAAASLRNAQLSVADFRTAAKCIRKGDLVYLDPPYTTSHNQNGFIKYNRRLFSLSDQTDLANFAKEMSARGAFVIVSNADYPDIRELYSKRFTYQQVTRSSIISAKAFGRKETTEALFVSRNLSAVFKGLS